jgi:hypothetical protein
MNMVIPNEGKILLLDRALCAPTNADEDYSLFMFTNNVTVVDASTLADFTAATFTGGGAISITRSSMPLPVIVANVAITTRATAPSWTNTGATTETCFGWILKGATSGKVIAGQNFDTPRVMSPGSIETLDPFAFKLKTFA